MKIKKKEPQVSKASLKRKKALAKIQKKFLSTGCTLLNLACSGSPFGGYMKGKYYFLVGDSTSGKTFFSMTCMAEATRNENFKDYRLIYDNVEDGMLMDIPRLFGTEVNERIEPPATDDDGDPVYSGTIEEFYYNLDDAIKQATPFIYVLDSMDGLSSEAEGKKFGEQKKASRSGKEAKGSYGDGKAKKNSSGLRRALAGIRDTNSILIIIAQTRDILDAAPFGPKKTRSGGHALKFYASVEIWTSLGGQIKRQVRGKQRKIGDKIRIRLKKNRVTGKLHEVWAAIYPSYGVDDIGSNINYLVAEKWWVKSGKTVKAKEFDLEIPQEKLVREIESSPGKIRKLQRIVGKCWKEIEDACALDREGRY